MGIEAIVEKSTDVTVVQVMDSIGKNRGGLTNAVFDRFSLLASGRRAVLVTVAYQPDVRSVFEELKRDGSIPAQTELFNFYEDQRLRSRLILPRADMPHEDWEAGNPFQEAPETTNHGSLIRYFAQGSFVGLVYRDAQNVLRHVDKHDPLRPWVREYRDTCWADGLVARREYFDEQNKVRFRIYIDIEKRAYLSAWVTPDGYEYRTIEHLPSESIQHGDTRAANAAWLARQLADIGPSVVYTDEPRTTFALAVSTPVIFHVTSIHTTHYKNNMNNSDGIKHWATHYVNHMDNIGKLVFFTETQRTDFAGDTDFPTARMSVVPHAAPLDQAKEISGVNRSTSKFVTVSRIAEDKRIDDAIRAFAVVHKKFPDATYEIWGSGPSLESLKALIIQLGLQDSVSLCGHTTMPLAKFASATASVLTSKYEGFGLVITESFACGTPVIAYNVIYGPRDVISATNGLLVEDGNIKALSDAMILTLTDSSAIELLRMGAQQTASRYTAEVWSDGWKSTLESGDIEVRT